MDITITAQEIKEIRGMYGLTQRSFALLLGIGPASMVRYEQGSRPSKANANLIRAARHPEFMRECLERDGDLIPRKQCEQASRYIYAIVSLDSNEEEPMAAAKSTQTKHAPTMDEVYHYTIQQEVLNEQAANLACDMMEYLMNCNVKPDDKTHPVSVLLSQLLELKRFLVSGAADDDLALERARGFLGQMEEFVKSLKSAEEVA